MSGFYRKNWYNLGLVLFVALAFTTDIWGQTADPMRTLLVYAFMALLVHQYEEYGWPGGGPLVVNAVMYGERRDYDRYPGNRHSSMLVNTVGAYSFYLLAILFAQVIWLGLAVMAFGLFQILGHGLVMNMRGRTFYNPGLASAVLLLGPIAVAYGMKAHALGLVTAMDYLYAGLAFIASVVVILVLPIRAWMDRNSPYAMSAEEMTRFGMLDKLRAKGLIDG